MKAKHQADFAALKKEAAAVDVRIKALEKQREELAAAKEGLVTREEFEKDLADGITKAKKRWVAEHATAESVVRAYVDAKIESITSSLRSLPTREFVQLKLKKGRRPRRRNGRRSSSGWMSSSRDCRPILRSSRARRRVRLERWGINARGTWIAFTGGSEAWKRALTGRSARRFILYAAS